MNTTAYKGFTVTERKANGSRTAEKNIRFFVEAEGFNPDGYATLNNAKGAITKHINACESQRSVFVQSVINTDTSAAKAATSDDSERASVPAATISSAAPAPGWTGAVNTQGDPISADTGTAHLYALLDYHGMTRQRDSRSRNKREGTYTRRLGYKGFAQTRKTRKATKMRQRAIRAYNDATYRDGEG